MGVSRVTYSFIWGRSAVDTGEPPVKSPKTGTTRKVHSEERGEQRAPVREASQGTEGLVGTGYRRVTCLLPFSIPFMISFSQDL